MATEKLSKRIVDALKAPDPSKVGVKVREHFVWDRELRGFGVHVMPSGLKSFVIQYRVLERRNRRAVIGRYGLMTVEDARKLAHEKLVAVSKGVDPIAEEAKAAGLLTVAEVCDWYLAEAEAGRILGRHRRPIKPSTLAMDRSRIEAHIKPLVGRRQVGSLKLGDIEGAQADIAAGKTSKPRAGGRGRRWASNWPCRHSLPPPDRLPAHGRLGTAAHLARRGGMCNPLS
jgi:Arm DNA-binding domain